MSEYHPKADEVLETVDGLLSGWDDFIRDPAPSLSRRGTGSRRGRDRTEVQVAVILALATHVHATAAYLRPVLGDQVTVVQMPLVRAIFESTLHIVWVDEVDDAVNAFVNEAGRSRRNLSASLARTHTLKDWADQIRHTDWVDLDTTSTDQAKHFERLAEDIALGGAYAYYRLLCQHTHPTVAVVDQYLVPEEFSPEHITLRTTPTPLTPVPWTHIVASCLVWSGMVVNYLDPARQRRAELRRAAASLHIPAELAVRDTAIRRGATKPRSPQASPGV